tara:strand:- start:7039 stop:7569 length:531 start_codon:yes stop_codon:yes gene_type:complete
MTVSKENKKLTLWEKVETTDPEFTTKVNQRGGFTAIGAMYQIKNATEVFGPFGKTNGGGWGVKDELYTPIMNDTLIVYTATFYYDYYDEVVNDKGENEGIVKFAGEFPISSSIKTMMGNKVDDDCIKKVQTDALTKGLSKLGFNADVFMGRFDDNKYVNTPKDPVASKTGGQDEWI